MKLHAYQLIPFTMQLLAWGPTRLLLNAFCHFKIYGLEHVRNHHRAILAVNHANELDSIVVTAALNPLGALAPLFYVTAPMQAFKNKEFGWRRFIYGPGFFKLWGAYPVIAKTGSYENAFANFYQIARDGNTILIFPEGKMSTDGTIAEAHGGVAYLAAKTGLPVIPCYVAGTHRIGITQFLLCKRHVSVTFGTPMHVPPHENRPIDTYYREQAKRIQEQMVVLQRSKQTPRV